jgi:hypothetical protein
MLYNPKWSKTKPTLRGFISWLEKQNPRKKYRYMFPDTCVTGLYAQSLGKTFGTLLELSILQEWDETIAEPLPHTFGAALKRAKAFAKDR